MQRCSADQLLRLTVMLEMLHRWMPKMPGLLETLLRSSGGQDTDSTASAVDKMHTQIALCIREYDGVRLIWSQSLRGAPHFLLLLNGLCSRVLPKMIMDLVHVMTTLSPSDPASAPCLRTHDLMISTIQHCTLLLRLDNEDWPPSIKVRPALGDAFHALVRWARGCSALKDDQADHVITLVRQSLMLNGPISDVVSPSMVTDLQEFTVSLYDRVLYPRCDARRAAVTVVNNLIYAVLFAIRTVAAASSSTPLTHLAAKLAIVSIASCDALMPQQTVKGLFDLIQVIPAPTAKHARPTLFSDATVIRALHDCSIRYPATAADCTVIIALMLPCGLVDGTTGELVHMDVPRLLIDLGAMQGTFGHCVARAVRWIARGCRDDPLLQDRDMHMLLFLFADIMSFVTHVMGPGIGMDVGMGTRVQVMSSCLAQPGSLIALEALLRGRGRDVGRTGRVQLPLTRDPKGVQLMTFIRAAYFATNIVLSYPPQASLASRRTLLGLNSTLLKMTRSLYARGLALPDFFLSVLVSLVDRGKGIGLERRDKHGQRLFMLHCWALQLVISGLEQGDRSALLQHLVEEELAAGHLERYAQRYDGELLCFCSNPRCTNLDGPSDATMRTWLCKGCRRMRYCGVACQRQDWREGGHSRVCRAQEGASCAVVDSVA